MGEQEPKIQRIRVDQLKNFITLLENEERYNALLKLWPSWKLELAKMIEEILMGEENE
ncbi:MAG: hypothetical protein QXP84_05880 [Candidatus Korarchaeum sp.]